MHELTNFYKTIKIKPDDKSGFVFKRGNMIKAVFIDVDNTLIDFNKSACLATEKAMQLYSLPFSRDKFFSDFVRINDMLWKKIEQGTLTREELLKLRFKLVLKEWGVDFDGEIIEKQFRQNLRDFAVLIDGAKELLTYLKEKYKVFVCSNAHFDLQQTRLKLAGIHHYFDDFFVSETIGYDKPSKEFFDKAIKLSGFKKEEIIMIGDSLSADIKGGKNAGIKTIWFDYFNLGSDNGINPDFVVKRLQEIKNII